MVLQAAAAEQIAAAIAGCSAVPVAIGTTRATTITTITTTATTAMVRPVVFV